MYRMVVVDDDAEFCMRIREITAAFFARQRKDIVITSYIRARDLLWDLEDNRLYNIYCLDIKMPDMTGLELARHIRLKDGDGCIIFLTSYKEYSLEGYQYNAWRYILKGSEQEKLPAALTAAAKTIESVRQSRKYYVIEKYHTPTRICLDDIYYFQVEKKYTVFYTLKGVFRERRPRKEVMSVLREHGFFPLDKSCAVSLRNVSQIDGDEVVLINNERLPISVSHRTEIKKALADYWRRQC